MGFGIPPGRGPGPWEEELQPQQPLTGGSGHLLHEVTRGTRQEAPGWVSGKQELLPDLVKGNLGAFAEVRD